ncbi:multifunctional CCA addition/repair protein [Hahella sp. KA22]|uniref:multifunctional CCA addition/repair protein n=1 Tax=Hahella sp. KA22 TaxID=1628392 RepID=UPI000FDEDAFE|nr:multifunctional CCA addition/repair protein [Hahella sp. KA22]AZZ94030.1 multifunctional CCA addition/repair protein [Hahella sp. KA22]QAY57404.1 multifunctional CCA addition/repair protein [Hahella sp. KA22]
MQRYLVGGAVRDALLGLPVKDRDWVVVGSTPEQMLEQGYQQVGADFPVFLHPDSKEEHALARTERKNGKGYTGFICDFSPDISLEDDLLRRDLTINAMAMDDDGALVDPFNGRQDLEARILRHVSPAFTEDPLRVLRVARFASRYADLGFTVAPETLQLMQDIQASGELKALTAERVWQETVRALGQKQPRVYFQVLKDAHALQDIFPELNALFGVPQTPQYHPEVDTGLHSLMALEQACLLSEREEVRFAALIHDLGKGVTPQEEWPKHHNHEAAGVDLVKALTERVKAPKLFKELALMACQYHTHCHRALELRANTLVKLLQSCDAWRRPDRFELFLLACEADARGRTGWEQKPYPQADYLRGVLEACQQIQPQELVAQGYTGARLGEEIQRRRISAVKRFKRDYAPETYEDDDADDSLT